MWMGQVEGSVGLSGSTTRASRRTTTPTWSWEGVTSGRLTSGWGPGRGTSWRRRAPWRRGERWRGSRAPGAPGAPWSTCSPTRPPCEPVILIHCYGTSTRSRVAIVLKPYFFLEESLTCAKWNRQIIASLGTWWSLSDISFPTLEVNDISEQNMISDNLSEKNDEVTYPFSRKFGKR